MKTTVELPESLVKQIKLHAVREGRKLQDVMADLLRRGLSAVKGTRAQPARPVISRDPETGLPVVQCLRKASKEESSADRLADILLAQDVEFHVSGR